ncbi:hypothetical protein GCM10010306_019380 [Streptomyces umbrinus]|uniref:hypothetical protein n=1 Tax=Streptomyces umbrinus TaxID=67370 RepID=UPI00167AB858|nr:hypothetical protein [Streptomyces umbrinus]GHB26191.1 hypothetical protein GCM10010306_019380 [Streptomyces umbrinus]
MTTLARLSLALQPPALAYRDLTLSSPAAQAFVRLAPARPFPREAAGSCTVAGDT